MPYNLVDSRITGYTSVKGTPFVDFDAGQTFLEILKSVFPQIEFTSEKVAERLGQGDRKECLFRMTFKKTPASSFYVYCFQTEGGGRSSLPDEARIQWRPHSNWSPDLNVGQMALTFATEIAKTDSNLTGKELYILAFYKRDKTDKDIIISAVYPTQAQDVEVNSDSGKSIQYRYPDIRDAYLKGASGTSKGNNQRIVHFQPQYLFWYMINRDSLHTSSLHEFNAATAALVQQATSQPVAGALPLSIPRNKIIYGAPGTGKSYELRAQARVIGFSNDCVSRVTFHPSYSYQQFVGAYKPTPIYKSLVEEGTALYGSDKVTKLQEPNNKEPLIDYSFVPGTFLSLLINALKNVDKNYILIIEEINRASVSAVFGDIFQLLDRSVDGTSEYEIEFNSDITSYLQKHGITSTKTKLPSNLFIWATMNSADQGVLPLDAAFKRRWTFEYLPLDSKSSEVNDREILFNGFKRNWNQFRGAINDKLKLQGVPEDKLIGPFFLNATELASPDSLKNKLLLYLRDDVVRHNPEVLFIQKTFSDIVKAYDNGEDIFHGVMFTEQPSSVVGDE